MTVLKHSKLKFQSMSEFSQCVYFTVCAVSVCHFYSEHEIPALNQMSWLMKTASIELRVTSLNRQRSHTQRLLQLLLDDVPVRSYLGKWNLALSKGQDYYI